MRRIRPARVLTAALTTTLGLALLTWAADPAWARAAGLDVWNVGTLEDDLRGHTQVRARLEGHHAACQYVHQQNEALVQELVDGRRSLPAAAEVLYATNQPIGGFAAVIDYQFHGPTPLARAADNLLHRVDRNGFLTADVKARVLTRLRAEYAAAYGVPAAR